MLMTTCFSQTHTLHTLFQSLSVAVIIIGFILMAYVVFTGMYYDSISSEEYDTSEIDNHDYQHNESQDLTLSKLFNKNK